MSVLATGSDRHRNPNGRACVGHRMVLKIGEVARRAGVSVRALRYYEQQGLLQTERTAAGQRIYQESDVDRVRLYQQFYAAGLTSRQIAQLLPCIDSGHSDAEQRTMLTEQRDRIQSRVEELIMVLGRLDTMINDASAQQ